MLSFAALSSLRREEVSDIRLSLAAFELLHGLDQKRRELLVVELLVLHGLVADGLRFDSFGQNLRDLRVAELGA